MGCDIHIFIEYKVGDEPWKADHHHVIDKSDPEYHSLNQVTARRRNYNLFAKLAGVRGFGPKPRNIPKDISELIDFEIGRYGNNGHSHSWATLQEFEDALLASDYNANDFINAKPDAFSEEYSQEHSYPRLIAYCKATVNKLKLNLEMEQVLLDQPINTNVECRLIYFFDN